MKNKLRDDPPMHHPRPFSNPRTQKSVTAQAQANSGHYRKGIKITLPPPLVLSKDLKNGKT